MSDDTTDNRNASRKWRFALLLVAIGVGMELAGKLTPLLVEYLKWIFLGYCGYNVTQKGVEWVAQAIASKKSATETAP